MPKIYKTSLQNLRSLNVSSTEIKKISSCQQSTVNKIYLAVPVIPEILEIFLCVLSALCGESSSLPQRLFDLSDDLVGSVQLSQAGDGDEFLSSIP